MSPVRDGFFVRPLLQLTRREILDYLDERGQAFRTDSSNAGICISATVFAAKSCRC
ncbi:MAG: ATP-binding protein [Nitrospiraceae bacterium]